MNVIRNSFTLARKDLKIIFKDRGQLAVLFVLPLLFALFMGGSHAASRDLVTTSGESRLSIKTYIVNEDQGPYGAQVEEVLRDIQSLQMRRSYSVGHADKLVGNSEAAAAIIIPADFSARIDSNQPTMVKLIKDPTRQAEAQAVAGILKEVLTELNVRAEIEYGIRAVYDQTGALQGADPKAVRAAQAQTMGVIWTAVQEIRQNPAIAVQREDLAGEERLLPISGVVFGYIMPMFATMFAFFLVGFMAESILKEKEAGSFRRLLVAPIYPVTIVAGKMLAFIGVVFLQMLVLFGICRAFFDMPLGDSPLALLALTLALALAATGLGMLVGSLARTSKQAGSIGMLLGFVLFFAAGFITAFSLEITGNVVEVGLPSEGFSFYLSQLTPHPHALDGYLKLILHGAGFMDILPNILALLGFAAVFFLVAMLCFKFD
jgi:ABC-2 type transport system permease protein